MRVLRLEVSVYNVNVTNHFQTTFAKGGGGGGYPLEVMTMNSKEENSLVPITSKNSATVEDGVGIKTSALQPLMEIFRRTPLSARSWTVLTRECPLSNALVSTIGRGLLPPDNRTKTQFTLLSVVLGL